MISTEWKRDLTMRGEFESLIQKVLYNSLRFSVLFYFRRILRVALFDSSAFLNQESSRQLAKYPKTLQGKLVNVFPCDSRKATRGGKSSINSKIIHLLWLLIL